MEHPLLLLGAAENYKDLFIWGAAGTFSLMLFVCMRYPLLSTRLLQQ